MSKYQIEGTKVVDLSQTIEPGIPGPVGFPGPQIEVLFSQDKGDTVNVERVTIGDHTATHVDAPFHFFSNLQKVDELPPESLIGPAVVVDLRQKKGSVPIEAVDIKEWEAKNGEKIQPGDAVLLHTGHSKLWGLNEAGDRFWKDGFPYMTEGSVNYLVEKKIRLIGVESMDLDLVDPYDLSTAKFTAHRTFLSRGILIVENLTNLDKISSKRCQIIAAPLKLKGCSGSPVRVLAIF
jgi:arylformamidase